ncbi:MAG: UDP-N-acetyl-D-mannosamine dehydrogenase [Methanoregulaceae archaeon PtaB.Bin056]|nr:MAG: UDP-N-acetyl-D-mannosamine dehydrogenase [Methanoregulaceae archaeon PtaB.Bin056]
MARGLAEAFEKRGPIRTIGVVGMGYVGIPAAALFADVPQYQKVYGFQRDSATSGYKIAMLNCGESPLGGDEPCLAALIKKVVAAGKFSCTADFSRISSCDAVTIAIQTPFRDPGDLLPDFSALHEGIRLTGRHLSEGTLVVLESTVTPGTTAGTARRILEEESGMVAGEDFGLAHAPERVMVGRLIRNLQEHDRIIGGIDDTSTMRACDLYSPILVQGRIIPMSATAAEVEKTAENTFRDLQIAAANQLALYCEAMGVNFYDVRKGIASLKEEGVTRAILWPGAGVGGHCLTKDTYHLERGAKVLGGNLDWPGGERSLFLTARAINDFMPTHMLHLTHDGLARAGKEMKGSKVAILGWAFIADSDDARNTPSEVYRDLVVSEGAEVSVHDPWVEEYPGVAISSDLERVITGADAVAVFTGHREYRALDPGSLKRWAGVEHPVIVDGRNVVDPDSFIRYGWVYKGIGRGDKNGHAVVGCR